MQREDERKQRGPDRDRPAAARGDEARADEVTRANEEAQDQVGGGKPEPGLDAGKEAVGVRLGSTDSARRAVEPLTPSNSDDTGEAAPRDRYAKG